MKQQFKIESLVQSVKERTLGNILNVAELENTSFECHAVVAGQTRSGKTTLGKVLFSALTGHRIFFNISNDREIYGLSDITVFTPQELFEAIGLGKQRINYVPPTSNNLRKEHVLQIYNILMMLGTNVAKLPQATGKFFWATFIVDEAHLVAPKHSKDDGLSLLTTRGAGVGVRCVAITQRPSLLSQTVLSQSPYYFIFYVSPFEQKYFKSYSINLSRYKEFIDYQLHRFIYYDGFRTIGCEALKNIA